ncbi:MAG: alpha/beta fold hydrolase, partial [Comamonadaceae bacterium]
MDAPLQADSGRCNVPGAALAWRLDGPADAPVVMLGNSLAADLSMWDGNLPALTARFRVLRYDTRGHGGSSTPPAPYTLPQLADDAIALLDALRIDQVH